VVRVTNDSSAEATDVNLVKVWERPYRARVLSVTTSQGSCGTTSCSLGRLAPGLTATITVVTRALRVGEILNVVHVGSEEPESDYLNNTASALVRVTGPRHEVEAALRAASCQTLGAAPALLRKGATSIVLTTARNSFGTPVPGVRVVARGLGIDQHARTNRRGVARFVVTPPRAGILFFGRAGGRLTQGARSRCRTLLGVLGATHVQVTG
jgi:hypothetical protein